LSFFKPLFRRKREEVKEEDIEEGRGEKVELYAG
jgi:hypothetical protein